MKSEFLDDLRRIFAFRPYLLVIFTLAMVYFSAAGEDSLGMLVLGILGTPVVLLLCCLWPRKWQVRYWIARSLVVIPLSLVILLTVVWTAWPLHLNFIHCRPELSRLAARVEGGEKIATPIRVGLFTVYAIELRRGIVCLWTSRTGTESGLVKATSQQIQHGGFNVWSVTPLDKDWTLYQED